MKSSTINLIKELFSSPGMLNCSTNHLFRFLKRYSNPFLEDNKPKEENKEQEEGGVAGRGAMRGRGKLT